MVNFGTNKIGPAALPLNPAGRNPRRVTPLKDCHPFCSKPITRGCIISRHTAAARLSSFHIYNMYMSTQTRIPVTTKPFAITVVLPMPAPANPIQARYSAGTRQQLPHPLHGRRASLLRCHHNFMPVPLPQLRLVEHLVWYQIK